MATTRNCPYCGAPVDPDAAFCTNCGNRLDDIRKTYQRRSVGKTVATVIVAIAAGLVIAAGVLVAINYLPGEQTSSTTTTSAASDTSGSSSSSATDTQDSEATDTDDTNAADSDAAADDTPRHTTDEDESEDSDDDAIKESLQGYVQTLNQLDGRVRGVADDFNAYVQDGTSSQRRSALQSARGVQSSIDAAADEFAELSVPGSSAYYDDYQSMRVCFDDLQHRIDCMVESWELRQSGSSSYLDPIAAQNDSNGVNTYKTDFDQRMAALSL